MTKQFHKSKLALAMGAALGAAAVAPSAHAVNLATDNLGEVLIFPYYTVQNGQSTLFNITNTDPANSVAVRARFREYKNSRDVFDFVIVLSPNDVWNGWIVFDEANGARLLTNDESCTVPEIPMDPDSGLRGQPFSTLNLTDGGGLELDRLREGYLEVIQLGGFEGELPPLNRPQAEKCEAVVAQFNNRDADGFEDLQDAYDLYPRNPLKGVMNIVSDVGQNVAWDAVTLADFYQIPDPDGESLVTLQLPPTDGVIGLPGAQARFLASYHEPTLASSNTPAQVLLDNGDLATTNGLYAANEPGQGILNVSFVLQRSDIINQWTRRTVAQGAAWDTKTDWVVTFPTKNFFVDTCGQDIEDVTDVPTSTDASCARNVYRMVGNDDWNSAEILLPRPSAIPNVIAGEFYSPFSSRFVGGESCSPVSYTIWDREELEDVKSPVFSPAPAGDALCYEVNVLTFLEGNALGSPNSYNVTFDFDRYAGWMDLFLGNDANYSTTEQAYYGMPVTGLGYTSRSTSTGTVMNDAVAFSHAYLRNVPEDVVIPAEDLELP